MKVIFCCGIWDLLHKGHLNLLRAMRKEGDELIVIVHDDFSCYAIKDKIPVQDTSHRVRNLKITGIPDKILIAKSRDLTNIFKSIFKKYQGCEFIYMRRDDAIANFPCTQLFKEHHVKIQYIPYTKRVSSSKIKEKLLI